MLAPRRILAAVVSAVRPELVGISVQCLRSGCSWYAYSKFSRAEMDLRHHACMCQDAAALEPACTLAEGLATQYVLDAARQSSAEGGGWVTPKRVSEA